MFFVMTFPMKNSVLDNFPLCPPAHPPPLKSANFIFIVVSLSLSFVLELELFRAMSFCRGATLTRWPDLGICTKNTETTKKKPRPEILNPQKTPPEYPENCRKYPRNTKNARFGSFSPGGISSVFFSRNPQKPPRKYQKIPPKYQLCSFWVFLSGGYFFGFFFFRRHSGSCMSRVSVAGRGVLKEEVFFEIFSSAPMRGVLARGRHPSLLDLLQAQEHHEPGPLPAFEPGPKGQGVPAREGLGSWLSRTVGGFRGFAKGWFPKRWFCRMSDSVKRHLSRRHLSVLNFLLNFIFDGGYTCEKEIRFY